MLRRRPTVEESMAEVNPSVQLMQWKIYPTFRISMSMKPMSTTKTVSVSHSFCPKDRMISAVSEIATGRRSQWTKSLSRSTMVAIHPQASLAQMKARLRSITRVRLRLRHRSNNKLSPRFTNRVNHNGKPLRSVTTVSQLNSASIESHQRWRMSLTHAAGPCRKLPSKRDLHKQWANSAYLLCML